MKCGVRLHITKVDFSDFLFWFRWIYSLLCRSSTLNYAASCDASPIRTVAPCMTDKCHITLTHSHANDFSPVIHSNDFDSHRSINWDFAHPSATLDNWNNEIESTFKWPITLKKTIQNGSRSTVSAEREQIQFQLQVKCVATIAVQMIHLPRITFQIEFLRIHQSHCSINQRQIWLHIINLA